MRRMLAAVLVLAISAGTGAHAESGQLRFLVQVSVPVTVTLDVLEQPDRLLLSAADVERGYRDVAAHYLVRRNTGRGSLLRFVPRLGLTQYIEVRGLRGTVIVDADTVEVFQPGTTRPQDLLLQYRFKLQPGVQPGSYELPILISVATL